MSNFTHRKLALAVALSLGLNINAVQAEDDKKETKKTKETKETKVLEVIKVTSQKRVESIQDVPISVAALSDEELRVFSIDKVEDLQLYIPNLSMTETGLSTQTFIRGIGTGNNQGFEQSVVQFIDGVSYARQQLSRAPFFDMERAEVLRGPLSILFGKNAIGGALNFSTASVEEDNSGKVLFRAGENGIREFQGVLNRELVDSKLYGRIAVRSYEEDGYVYNSLLEQDEPNRSEDTIRAKLLYLPTDTLTINFKYETNSFDSNGRQIEILQDNAATGPSYATTLGAGLGLVNALPETEFNYTRSANGDSSRNESKTYVLSVNQVFGSFDLEAKSAWLEYDFDENCDCDFVGANIFTAPMQEEYEQFSQEIRLLSTTDGSFSWQTGVFYQTSDLIFNDAIRLPSGNVGEPQNAVLPSAVASLTQSVAMGNSLSGVSAYRDFTQTTDSISVFAEGKWDISEKLKVAVGARWTQEEKDGYRELNIIDNDTGTTALNPLAPLVLGQLFGIESQQTTGHLLEGNKSESAVDPSLKVQYYFDNDTMIYATTSTGSKSGGFDTRANTVTSFEFEGEEAVSYELGLKNTFWESRARFNAALFYTDYKDLQVSQFDGTLGFVVGNADAEVKGIEIDGSVLISEDLILTYSAAYLDHEYTDYKNGNCYYMQGSDAVNPSLADRYNPETGLCDYTGLTGQFSPKFSSNLNLEYFRDIAYGLELNISLNYNYTDKQNVHQNLDPVWEVDSTSLVNLNIGILGDDWGIELLGTNITDEKVVTFASNVPLSGTFGADAVSGFVAPLSTWSLRAFYQF